MRWLELLLFRGLTALIGDGGDGESRGREGGVEVEAACGAVDVDEFTREEKAREAFAFHGLRVDFVKGDAADGYDGFF